MTYVSWRGVEIGERIQNILLGIQYLALAIFVVAALWQFFAGTAPDPTPVRLVVVQPVRVRRLGRVHRGDPARALHLLGLGHLPRPQRGDEGSQAHPRPRRAADDRHPARHLRRRHDRGDDVRRSRHRRAPGSATRRTPTTSSSRSRTACSARSAGCSSSSVMISAISSTQTTILPTARGTLAMAAYKALPRRFATVHPRYKTPSFSTLVMGIVADRLLRRHDADQRQHPAGLDPVARSRDRVLLRHHRLRVRLVLPARAVQLDAQLLLPVPVPAAGLAHAHLRVRAVGDRHVRRRLRLLGAVRHRRHLRARHRSTGVRRPADVPVVRSSPGRSRFFRGESLNRETPVLVPDDPSEYLRSVDGGI